MAGVGPGCIKLESRTFSRGWENNALLHLGPVGEPGRPSRQGVDETSGGTDTETFLFWGNADLELTSPHAWLRGRPFAVGSENLEPSAKGIVRCVGCCPMTTGHQARPSAASQFPATKRLGPGSASKYLRCRSRGRSTAQPFSRAVAVKWSPGLATSKIATASIAPPRGPGPRAGTLSQAIAPCKPSPS